ncbi:MAG: hypothetical protein LQ348_003350 [Seirophora lacunosa]|nr:MAG: hypothetical protein LQ348_003350 [Seirophora lacunosa]
MDPPPPVSRSISSRPASSALSSRTTPNAPASGASGNEHDHISQEEAAGPLRRGHSDGDVLGSQLRSLGSSRRTNEGTWMDFLQDSSRPADDADTLSRRRAIRDLATQDPARRQERQAAIMQRAALVLADRKRRLTESQEDHIRRRSASSLPFGPPTAAQRSTFASIPPAEPSFAEFGSPPNLPTSSTNDRHQPRRSDVPSARRRASREIRLPRWQPDSEVTSCPICGKGFGFLFRKHHCRKCGRVVCANCSPHRITIPRQFIVQPPQDTNQESNARSASAIEVVDLTDDHDVDAESSRPDSRSLGSPQSPVLHIDPALGGGQEVRLCNPCVPDPNPLPHLPFEVPGRPGIHSFPRPELDASRSPSNDSLQRMLRRSSHQSGRTHVDVSHVPSDNSSGAGSSDHPTPRPSGLPRQFDRLPRNYPVAYGSVPDRPVHDRYLESIRPPPLHRHRHHASTSTVPDSRYRSLSDLNAPLPPRPLPSRPQPQLREEDECPICHQALPPKGPDESETARERHVVECIEQHFSTSTPRSSRPHPSAATEAAFSASAAGARQSQAAGGSGTSDGSGRRGSEGAGDNNDNAFQRMGSQRRRVAGMVTYSASEKDCMGEGGEAAECVICFEEFEQGAEMGRLECLCKFHKIHMQLPGIALRADDWPKFAGKRLINHRHHQTKFSSSFVHDSFTANSPRGPPSQLSEWQDCH